MHVKILSWHIETLKIVEQQYGAIIIKIKKNTSRGTENAVRKSGNTSEI